MALSRLTVDGDMMSTMTRMLPNKSLATRDGVAACPVLRGSAFAVDITAPAWLSSGHSATDIQCILL
jgi:hypothetical protein